MKKHFLFFVVLFVPSLIFSQDLISFKNGEVIYDCKIIKEDSLTVYYQYTLNGKNISTSANKDQIQKCFYGDYSQISFSNNSFEFYQNKLRKYIKIQKRGKGFAISGGLLTLTGIVLYSTANKEYKSDNSFFGGSTYVDKVSTSGVIGECFIIAGIPMLTMGIIFNSVGSKNILKYQNKLRYFSFDINCKPHQQGFTISYCF